jgi:hypothetical protein
MGLLDVFFVPRATRQVLEELENVRSLFPNHEVGYMLVRRELEVQIRRNAKGVAKHLKTGPSPRDWLISMMATCAADMVETGRFHVYRGVLNPNGNELLAVTRLCGEEMVRLGAIDAEFLAKQMKTIGENVRDMG